MPVDRAVPHPPLLFIGNVARSGPVRRNHRCQPGRPQRNRWSRLVGPAVSMALAGASRSPERHRLDHPARQAGFVRRLDSSGCRYSMLSNCSGWRRRSRCVRFVTTPASRSSRSTGTTTSLRCPTASASSCWLTLATSSASCCWSDARSRRCRATRRRTVEKAVSESSCDETKTPARCSWSGARKSAVARDRPPRRTTDGLRRRRSESHERLDFERPRRPFGVDGRNPD